MQEMARRVMGIGNVNRSLGWEGRVQCRMCGIGVKSPVKSTKVETQSSQIKVFKQPIYLMSNLRKRVPMSAKKNRNLLHPHHAMFQIESLRPLKLCVMLSLHLRALVILLNIMALFCRERLMLER
jgi:hypothetical protein